MNMTRTRAKHNFHMGQQFLASIRPTQAPSLIFLRRQLIIKPTRPQPEPATCLDREALTAAGLAYLDGGLSIIPVNARKKPAIPEWTPFQEKQATREQVIWWAAKNLVAGFAVVCGEISGGLTIIDFDVPGFYESWSTLLGELAQALPTQRTGSGGEQVAFRSGLVVANDKLAWAPANNRMGREIAIETRGEGGYAVLPPSFCQLATKRGKRHRHPYQRRGAVKPGNEAVLNPYQGQTGPPRCIDKTRLYTVESRYPYPAYLVQDGYWFDPKTGELVGKAS